MKQTSEEALTFALSDRPCIQNVIGTASTKGTALFWPTERTPRNSIQIGSNFKHQTSRGSVHNAYFDSVGVAVAEFGVERFDMISEAVNEEEKNVLILLYFCKFISVFLTCHMR